MKDYPILNLISLDIESTIKNKLKQHYFPEEN